MWFSSHIWILQSSSAHILHTLTTCFDYSDNFEEYRPPFNCRWNFEHIGSLRQLVHKQHPPHQRQANRTEQRLCLCSALISFGMLFMESIYSTVYCFFRGRTHTWQSCIFLVQEASQLLTILQSLQPPLKLDGKTIGVDYAKSARKWVNTQTYAHDLSPSLAFHE